MDVMEAIRFRRSVRSFDSRPIPEPVLERLLDSLRWAPSACNNQPWKFVLVTEPDLRRELAVISRKQMWMAEAPMIVVACGYPGKAYAKMGGYGSSVDIDLAIALDHLSLAAAAEGIGTCWIGAFDETAVKVLLGVPGEAKVIAMMPVGYPKTADLLQAAAESRRKRMVEIAVWNRWS